MLGLVGRDLNLHLASNSLSQEVQGEANMELRLEQKTGKSDKWLGISCLVLLIAVAWVIKNST